jgi:hypothetical protein
MMAALLFRGSMVSGAANVESPFAVARILIPLIQERNDVRKATYDRRAPSSFHEKAGRSQDGFVFLSVDPSLVTEPPLSPSFHLPSFERWSLAASWASLIP